MGTRKTMKILLNGETRETAATNVAQLLRELDFAPVGLAVAVNQSVVRRANHAAHELNEGDIVEIIRAVQGG